jgi:hypothetical protein
MGEKLARNSTIKYSGLDGIAAVAGAGLIYPLTGIDARADD